MRSGSTSAPGSKGLKQREALGRAVRFLAPGAGIWRHGQRLSGQTHGQRGSLEDLLSPPPPNPAQHACVTCGSAATLGYKRCGSAKGPRGRRAAQSPALKHRGPRAAAGHGLAAASVPASLLRGPGAECPGLGVLARLWASPGLSWGNPCTPPLPIVQCREIQV